MQTPRRPLALAKLRLAEAQPAVAAVQDLLVAHGLSAPDVAAVEVTTFHEAARLAVRHPATTEQAQYSLPFPVAATISPRLPFFFIRLPT